MSLLEVVHRLKTLHIVSLRYFPQLSEEFYCTQILENNLRKKT